MTLAFFDDGLAMFHTYRLPKVQTRRKAYQFPGPKLMVLAASEHDDCEGEIVVHSNALREITKGKTEHKRLAHLYLAERMFLAMSDNSLDEKELLKLRIDELKMCARFLLRIGKIKREEQYAEIFSLLRMIEHDLGEPKRDKHKLRAAQDVATAVNYRSPKGQQPVGPVASMSVRGAITQIESRIRALLGIGTFADLHHALILQHIRDGEALFLKIKEAKSVSDLHEPVSRLKYLKANPFLAPARRIVDAYELYRNTDLLTEDELLKSVRMEAHGVVLLGFIERRVIRRLSDIQHKRVTGAGLAMTIDKTVALSKALEASLLASDAFSKDVRDLAITRLRTARNILSQDDLPNVGSSERRRAISAKRAMLDLTGFVAA